MYWFTADQHFNHSNIISKFVFRPFVDSEQMNRELIKRHNERVKPGHTVYHLGDFKFSAQGPNVYELAAQLNGHHVFIAGNHDKRNGLNSPLKYCVIETCGASVVLTHEPEYAIDLLSRGVAEMAFCGHVHEKWKFKETEHGDLVNVGIDQWDFYPVDAKQIFKAYKKFKGVK